MLAVFFVMAIQAVPARADTPAWKDAVADIAEIRDEAIDDLLDLVADFQEFLADDPSSAEATRELAAITAQMDEVAAKARDEVRSIMIEYPKAPQVQDSGIFAISLVGLARNYAIDQATLDFEEYVAGLPTTTTTTLPVTTTTSVPVTTTTSVPVTTTTLPVTTTSVPLPTTTTTTPSATTTTTRPLPATTTTTIPRSTTTTTTNAAGAGDPGEGPTESSSDAGSPGSPEGSADAAGGGVDVLEGRAPAAIDSPQIFEEPRLAPSFFSDAPGFTASLTRILEPVLPTEVAEMVVSPLLIFELLWRAISSSGRGLVMPISLLVFSLISLLWDRRSKRVPIAT